jgi:hypothetical protein
MQGSRLRAKAETSERRRRPRDRERRQHLVVGERKVRMRRNPRVHVYIQGNDIGPD